MEIIIILSRLYKRNFLGYLEYILYKEYAILFNINGYVTEYNLLLLYYSIIAIDELIAI